MYDILKDFVDDVLVDFKLLNHRREKALYLIGKCKLLDEKYHLKLKYQLERYEKFFTAQVEDLEGSQGAITNFIKGLK